MHEGGHERARELTARARAAGVEVLASAPALGAFDGLVAVWQGDTLHQVRAARIVYATGAIEQPLVFPGNDLPGVMLSGGARRLAALYGVAPGTRAVVAAVCDRGLEAAAALHDAGVELSAVADLRSRGGSRALNELMRRGVRPLHGMTVLEARGSGHVQGAVVGSPGAEDGDGEHAFGCDLLVVSGGSAPATSLLTQSGGRTRYDRESGVFVLDHLPDDVFAAGEVAGLGALEDAERSGATAGRRRGAEAIAPVRAKPAPSRTTSRRPRRARRADRRRRGAPRGDQQARGQVLRLPVRGRDREGHPPLGRGGLRLDRAVQALHDGHDGPLPGPHVPAAGRAADGAGDGSEPGGRSARRRRARPGTRCRWARSPAAPSSPPSARRSTGATASSARR